VVKCPEDAEPRLVDAEDDGAPSTGKAKNSMKTLSTGVLCVKPTMVNVFCICTANTTTACQNDFLTFAGVA
jgi:hypothetical protein